MQKPANLCAISRRSRTLTIVVASRNQPTEERVGADSTSVRQLLGVRTAFGSPYSFWESVQLLGVRTPVSSHDASGMTGVRHHVRSLPVVSVGDCQLAVRPAGLKTLAHIWVRVSTYVFRQSSMHIAPERLARERSVSPPGTHPFATSLHRGWSDSEAD